VADSTLSDIMRLARERLGEDRTNEILKQANASFEKEMFGTNNVITENPGSINLESIFESISKAQLGLTGAAGGGLTGKTGTFTMTGRTVTNNFNPEYQTPVAPAGYQRKVADARQDVLPPDVTVAVARVGDMMRENLTTSQAITALACALGEVIALHAHPGPSTEEPDLTRFEAVVAHATCVAVDYANEFRDHYEDSGLYKLRYK
jgi:hypothetical protein